MAHEHRATVAWQLSGDDFTKGRYSRAHEWRFDGGARVLASASPAIVPAAFVRAEAVDPEEAFVAALASCHMLTFLDLARRAGFVVESYLDESAATLERIDGNRMALTQATLRPRIRFRGRLPDEAESADLHRRAHELCFISNSVTTAVAVEPLNEPAP
jgi:organic hydroperoxide reductase OsmC/OhrA